MITVEVHFDHLDHAHLYVRRQERAATWDGSDFYKQPSIGATWSWTATRNILALLLRVQAATRWQLASATVPFDNRQIASTKRTSADHSDFMGSRPRELGYDLFNVT
jgi:hypothetical protein